MVHTVKGVTIVNKAEVDFFFEFPCFFHDPADVGNLISGFLFPYLTIVNSASVNIGVHVSF